ncbi:LysR substrate-binding domain-containing protein [Colwellia sp. Bg11-28]|jgi:LysR family glycine cleavage system transcriptional activator|uniref:LysR substrate-binding domain-containing protein n=1 Tax=Colwellia sp. Bg11-28 TaxID=2058305 RepID=UPI000C329900|nr:LysR substrate-binding domain-containing protein [Colwellia sp. Bg11-28]PKH86265.1 transcriptional regulator [Colwellia sp. Bg11-28]
MSNKLPALHLFGIFEAAARHENFKQAAAELFITPSAVSHQIKALEAFLGFELFQRKSRGVALNAAGKVYLHYVQQGINKLEQGTKIVSNKFSSPSLKISTFTTMASNVIIPTLSDFQQQHPTIDIRIETGMNLTDLRYDDCDLAIRMGKGDWPGVVVKKLLNLTAHAVCSAEFAKKHKLTSPEQISQVPLIDLANMNNIWRTWAGAMQLPEMQYQHKLTFGNYDASLQAAEQGLGLALAIMPIEHALIERNLLVLPFEKSTNFDQSLYAVYREEDQNRNDIHCFLDWLTKSPNLKPI